MSCRPILPHAAWTTRQKLPVPVHLSGLLNPACQPARRPMLAERRLVHNHVSRPLQVLNQPLGRDPRHCLIRVVRALPPVETEGEGKRLREFASGRRPEVGRVGHGGERSKNTMRVPFAAIVSRAVSALVLPRCYPHHPSVSISMPLSAINHGLHWWAQ
jgi:hypothetical protein